MYIVIYSRLITDWSVENINLDVTQYMMLLDVSVLPKKRYNKCLIFNHILVVVQYF